MLLIHKNIAAMIQPLQLERTLSRHALAALSRRPYSSTSYRRSVFTPGNIKFPPYKGSCVKLSVINGATTEMLANMLVNPAPKEQKYMRLADYSFLIESQHRNQKILFDLAFMKDLFTRMPPALKAMFSSSDEEVMKIEHVCDVPDALMAHGIELSAINDIIWSHSHIDHVGDPSVFPPTTRLVVGPGFKETCMPGYPTNPDAFVLDSAFTGRVVEEVPFSESSPVIGGFRAFDFFKDGSFWLLECPGHTGHHIGALCRTTENSWTFLGADCCHNVAQLRPSQFRSLPESVSAEVLGQNPVPQQRCLCTHLTKMLRKGEGSSFYDLAPMLQEDLAKAQETLDKLKAFDGRDDVLVILAHDPSLLDVIDFFPRSINNWKSKGWASQARWTFLKDINERVSIQS